MDFFVQNLSRENCLVVPPIAIIARAVFYLRQQKAKATVLVPFWPSSYFWPVITKQLAHHVVDYTVFDSKALEHGRNTNALFIMAHFGRVIIPVTDLIAAVYLYNRTTSSASSSSLVVAHAALKWLHTFVPYHIHNPMDAPIVRNILEASKRDKAKPVTKKLPLSSTIVKKIIEKHASRNADLKNLRIACI